MANKNLFKTIVGKLVPQTDALNEEGAPAYKFNPELALAQYAMTGCMNATFYASAKEQHEAVLVLAHQAAPFSLVLRSRLGMLLRLHQKCFVSTISCLSRGFFFLSKREGYL